jgi:hypothetical protein
MISGKFTYFNLRLAKYSQRRVNELTAQLDASLCLGSTGARVPQLGSSLRELLALSLADTTWDKYCSGWRAWQAFLLYAREDIALPLDISHFRSFAVWCLSVRNLSSDTVKYYMHSIDIAHSLRGMNCVSYNNDRLLKMILTGGKNARELAGNKSDARRAMTFATLLLISHQVACCDWLDISKQVVWAVCSLAFFTSARMGELLCKYTSVFDVKSTLIWRNVKFMSDNEMIIYLPCTKTSKARGEFVDVYPLDNAFCPVKAMKRLMSVQIKNKTFDLDLPVFAFNKSSFLTTQKLNGILAQILKDFYEPGVNAITCHSFRQGIPTIINSKPEVFSKEDAQTYGRWTSDSYLLYLKQHRDRRRFLFNKIANVLNIENK